MTKNNVKNFDEQWERFLAGEEVQEEINKSFENSMENLFFNDDFGDSSTFFDNDIFIDDDDFNDDEEEIELDPKSKEYAFFNSQFNFFASLKK